jgi:HEAT repeat protein
MGKKKDAKKEAEYEIQKIITRLKTCDETKDIDHEAEASMMETLIYIGKPAVPFLIELLQNHDTWMSSAFAADVLGEIGDTRAIKPLADALEDFELGEHAYRALKKFGAACISDVIQRIEYRIAHPIETGSSLDLITSHALKVLGDIHCDQSSHFLNNLLDDYISEMPDETFDPTTREWKYRNVEFFHLLDCLVRQQNISAIPHIKKARDCFPKEYTDYIICQIAIGRLKKGTVEGYLPMEAMEIAMPSGMIMDVISGGQYDWKDRFDEEYGEYFDEDEE